MAVLKILIVGNGKGSYQMRAIQLGAAIGACVTTSPADAEIKAADVVVLVKKHGAPFASTVRKFGKPIVWDALDFWSQPRENGADEALAFAILKNHINAIKPTLTIGATRAMAEACGGAYLPHHSWKGLTPTSARGKVQTVAYEGSPIYLGRWAEWLQAECRARGWAFVLNPPDLRVADLIVSLRDGQWDGWICQQWKSGVKLVNAIAAGRPVISQHSAAMRELQPNGSVVETRSQLSSALDAWVDVDARAAVVEHCCAIAPHYTLEAVASQYRAILQDVGRAWAA